MTAIRMAAISLVYRDSASVIVTASIVMTVILEGGAAATMSPAVIRGMFEIRRPAVVSRVQTVPAAWKFNG